MLLPDRSDPDAEKLPVGWTGSLNPRLPSIRDGEPPMPARTQKYAPPPARVPTSDPAESRMRVALLAVLLGVVAIHVATGLLPEWALWAVFFWICVAPGATLARLLPRGVRQWLEQHPKSAPLLPPRPTIIQTDAGDTWITYVPSVRVDDADRPAIRLPFRVMSAVVALLFMFLAMLPAEEIGLFERIASFLGGVVFGAIALVPDGDLTRMIPRISTAPRLPAGGLDGAD